MSSKIHTNQSHDGLAISAAVMVPGAVLALLSTTVVGVTVPDMIRDLDSNLATAQYVTSAYLLAAAIGIVASGWASVRIGLRRAWLAAAGLFLVGALAASVAPDMGWLIGARILQGLGGGALEPVMLTALARAAGPERMGRVMGAVAGAMSMGPLAGPVLGGLVADLAGWRWIFGGAAAITAGLLVAGAALLTDAPGRPLPLDRRGLALIGGSSAATLFGLSQVSASGGSDPIALAVLACGGALLWAFVAHARRRGEGAIADLTLFRAPVYARAIAIMALLGVAIYPLFLGLPLYFRDALGLSTVSAGLLMVPYGLGTAAAMPVAGRLSDRLPPRSLVWGGSGIAIAGFVLLIATPPQAPMALRVLSMVLVGVGTGAIGGPTVAAMYRALHPSQIPSGSTTMLVVNQLGGALGVAVLSLLIGGDRWAAAVGTTPLLLPVVAAVGIAALATALERPLPVADAMPAKGEGPCRE